MFLELSVHLRTNLPAALECNPRTTGYIASALAVPNLPAGGRSTPGSGAGVRARGRSGRAGSRLFWGNFFTPDSGRHTPLPPAAPHTPEVPVASLLPEAPASGNVYIDIAGRKVQVTLGTAINSGCWYG